MKATITSVGGRAPPARNTPLLFAGSRSLVATRALHVQAPRPARDHRSLLQGACRHLVQLGEPTFAAPLPNSPSSRQSIGSLPTVTSAPPVARTRASRLALAFRSGTCSAVP